MRQYVNVDEAVKRLATSIGIDTANLVKTQEQIKKNRLLHKQQLIQSLECCFRSPLVDPKKLADASQQLPTEEPQDAEKRQ